MTLTKRLIRLPLPHSNEIYKVHKNGGESEVVPLPPGGHGRLYGIVTVPSQCLHMSNRCAVNNGEQDSQIDRLHPTDQPKDQPI